MLKRLDAQAQQAISQHDYTAAEQAWRAALETAQALKLSSAITNMHNNLAMVYFKLKRFPDTIVHAQEAQRGYAAVKDQEGVCDNLLNEGLAHYELGTYEPAQRCFNASIEVAVALKDSRRLNKANNNLGMVYYRQREFAKALACYDQALSTPLTEDSRAEIANALNNQGLTFHDLGLYARALAVHQQAQPLFDALGDPEDIADGHNAQGMAYYGLQQYPEAEKEYKTALKQFQDQNDTRSEARVLNNLGILYDEIDQPDKGVDCLTKALEIKRKLYPPIAIALGLLNRGSVLTRLRRYDAALTDLNEARTLCKRLPDPMMTADVYISLGSTYAEQDRLKEAEAAYDEALQSFETISMQVHEPSEVGLFEQAHFLRLYAGYAALLLRKGHPQAALEMIERGRAQGLLQQARKNHLLLASPLPERTYVQLKSQVADRHPDTLFVEYVLVDAETTLVLTLSKAGIHAHVLRVGNRDLTRMATAWHKQLDAFAEDKGDKQAEEKTARALYTALLEPLASDVLARPAIRRLVIAADGPLLDIPFAALLDPARRRLVERYSLSEVVSLSTLALPFTPHKPTASMLAVGDPAGQDANPIGKNGPKVQSTLLDKPDEALPQLREGMQALLVRYPQSLGLFGKKAVKSEVKKRMGAYTVLNFGTHGKYIGADGLYSYLVLATGDGSNGLLEAREIVPLPLSAQMATLWACESGLGQRSGGDGLLGLAWAFQAAGCPSVVASQWKVDEKATALLMEAFYTALAKPDMRKDAALQEAMKVVRADARFHSPFYWAGFHVIGDTNPLTILSQHAADPHHAGLRTQGGR